jgi:hypothetical protein
MPRKTDFNLSLIASEVVPCSLKKFSPTASELPYYRLKIFAKTDKKETHIFLLS